MKTNLELSERQAAGAKLFDSVLAGLGDWVFRSHIIIDCQNYILRQLTEGKLTAYGFAKGSRTISLVPIYLFKYPEYVDWKNSKVIGHGLEYISVELHRPHARAKQPGAQEIKRVGRKPFRQLVEIIADLNRADARFASRTRKYQADEVRKLVETKYAEKFTGAIFPNEKTIKRYLKEHFDRLNARKSRT